MPPICAAGSAIVATNTVGDVLWREDYRPFGERWRNEPAAGGSRQWFHGKPEEALGIQYFGARYYDPTLRRFLGMDPVSFSDGDLHSFNRYAYGNNNPYRYRDNDGRLPVLLLVPLALKAIDVTLTAIDLIAAYQSDGAAGVAKEGIIAAAGVVVPGGRTLGAIAKHGDEVVTYAAKGVHKNSLSYVGETHVYRIKGPDGATHKIGESARGLNAEGASIRAEQQARRLTRETGDVYTTEIRKTFPDKASAREYETRVIERFRSMYGEDKLPGNLTNR